MYVLICIQGLQAQEVPIWKQNNVLHHKEVSSFIPEEEEEKKEEEEEEEEIRCID